MANENIQLVPVERKFISHSRGKYPHLIRQFLASGEAEMGVQSDDLTLAYLGLRQAVSSMGLKGRVYVQQQKGELHLIRRG